MPEDKPPITLDDLDRAPSSLPAPAGDQQVSTEVMRARFDQLADENFNLKDELGRLKRSISTSTILDGLLEPYASKAFWFMCAYCGVVCAILLSSGFKFAGFQLDSGVLQVLAGSTAVTVIGLVGMVLTGIFVGARKH